MKVCLKCGKEGEGNFCAYCGGTMEEVIIAKNNNEEPMYGVKDVLKEAKGVTVERTQEDKYSLYCLIAMGIFLALGFFKMLVYEYDDYDAINAYVGGDAYNFIINGTYATAYFVLAGSSFIGSILFKILDFLKNGK